jgi:hypothetical protein
MSNNPSSTLTRPRPSIEFCLDTQFDDAGETLICTRLNDHTGHCCDEIRRKAWIDRGALFVCKRDDYDHSAEKGLD